MSKNIYISFAFKRMEKRPSDTERMSHREAGRMRHRNTGRLRHRDTRRMRHRDTMRMRNRQQDTQAEWEFCRGRARWQWKDILVSWK